MRKRRTERREEREWKVKREDVRRGRGSGRGRREEKKKERERGRKE